MQLAIAVVASLSSFGKSRLNRIYVYPLTNPIGVSTKADSQLVRLISTSRALPVSQLPAVSSSELLRRFSALGLPVRS